ncbi:MAG TPA: thiamine phosphate synthase, partial [Terriglobales bacterium]|nr:thiamine phosphate synthase [Terriglobales bacterium]
MHPLSPFPHFYPILDAAFFPDRTALLAAAEELRAAGVELLQYRNKRGSARQILGDAEGLKSAVGQSVRLIMNDRADLCLAAGFDGLHVGQEDLSPDGARRVLGPDLWVGVSTHNPEQLQEADASAADYVAIGPVFATSTKQRPDPVVGLEGVRRARERTRKPLVAIGG